MVLLKEATQGKTFRRQCKMWGNGKEKGTEIENGKKKRTYWDSLTT